MAIIGYINEIIKNNKFDRSMKTALAYLEKLKESEFENLTPGEKNIVKLKDDKIFAINQVYNTKDRSLEKFEGHRKYSDIQYIFEGEELIKIASLIDSSSLSKYDENKDLQFFNVPSYSSLIMKKGMIGIFYPDDIHAPSLTNNKESIVKKTVVKIGTQEK